MEEHLHRRGPGYPVLFTSIADLGIPEGVCEVVGRRLTRLSDDANLALSRAAVIGREFDVAVLERVSGLGADHLLDVLDEAIAAGLVDELPKPTGSFRFAHAIVRETLYAELTLTRRVRLHRQVAEALDASDVGKHPERYSELAYHFTQAAASGYDPRLAVYAERAARLANGRMAFEEAERIARGAISALEEHASLRTDWRLHLSLLRALMGISRVPDEAIAESDRPRGRRMRPTPSWPVPGSRCRRY